MRSKYKKNAKVAWMYWKVAKAYIEFEFQQVMKSLSRLHPEAITYLCEVGYDRWARAYFSSHRYNVMTTNIAESFNALVKHARGLPITMLLEFIRDACTSPVTPWVEDKIAKRVRKSLNLEVHPITTERYQVLCSGQYDALVDLTEHTYTCRKFQLSKIPCMHVIVVAKYMKLTTCLQWVHSYYSTVFYQTVYADAVNPLGDQSKWLHPEEATVIHPPYMHRRRVGRPANKNRRPSQKEVVEQLICSRCHQPGHTRQNYRNLVPVPSSITSSSRRKKKDGK
ncbi:uncharacterized protein LOC123214249 [Mangifera indica]|uniref:uncharacterized protein LOC123214249 n=1 Tax=Mangifera indica TaxID=29780 RepID=UPI001CFBB92D|nr:uncharacterized protein LOC123214249 [Mangifera indica]